MAFSLKQSLTLSSKSQAYTYIYHPDTRSKIYKLIATYQSMAETATADVTKLAIHRVTYPTDNKLLGNKPVVAEKPHKTIQKAMPDELEAFLQEIGFVAGLGWYPVEDGDNE